MNKFACEVMFHSGHTASPCHCRVRLTNYIVLRRRAGPETARQHRVISLDVQLAKPVYPSVNKGKYSPHLTCVPENPCVDRSRLAA